MFKRKIEKVLNEYYERKDDPILIVTGARQIGRSFIIRETAKKYYKHYIEINLKDDELQDKIFDNSNSVDLFYMKLTSLYGNNLGNIDDTIIFLDEIQTYPKLISLLKALKIDNRYRFIASGSLLGITLKHIFVPLGYIKEIKMYPMDFEEFLIAKGCGEEAIEYLRERYINLKQIDEGMHNIFLERFKEYLISGGLPEAIKNFVIDKNVAFTRDMQTRIYNYYKDDASQYQLNNNLKIRSIYDNLASYMENKVKRIRFKSIEDDQRANLKKYQNEFDYLISSGSVLPIRAVSNPVFPLVESSSKNLIKLYYNDVGLLTNLLYKNNISVILEKDKYINLGSVYETVCATELIAHSHELYYFDSKKVGEVDFLLNDYDNSSVIAIEIKSGNDQNNFRALPKLLKEPYNIKKGYVFGNKNVIAKEGNIYTLPIYMIMYI